MHAPEFCSLRRVCEKSWCEPVMPIRDARIPAGPVDCSALLVFLVS